MTQATSSAGTSFAVEKAVVAVAAILTAAFTLIDLTGVILAVAAGGPAPTFSPARAIGVVRLEPYAPAVPPIGHLVAIGIVIVAVLNLVRRVVRWRARRASSTARRAAAFDALPGWASPASIRASASAAHLTAQAASLRPGLAGPRPSDLAYLLGVSKGQAVWASVERSILNPSRVFGPRWPRCWTSDGRPRSPRYVRYASRVRGLPVSKIGARNGTTRRLSIARTEFARPAPPLRPSTYTSWNHESVTCSTVNRTRASGTGGRADGMRARRDGSPSPRTASRDGSGSPAARFATARPHQALACALVSNIS